MKNIQVFDGAINSVYDIFVATDEEFSLIFPEGEDVAFIDEVYDREDPDALDSAFEGIWSRRIPECQHPVRQSPFRFLYNKRAHCWRQRP